LQAEPTEFVAYHDGTKAKTRQRLHNQDRTEYLENKQFIVWDGEGARSGIRRSQDYILLGHYNGTQHSYIAGKQLTTPQCLKHIIDTGRAYPNHWHVGFAFDYDVNMILRNLSISQFLRLKEYGTCLIGRHEYRVEHIPGKWFRVTKYEEPHNITVTIYDVWGFFQSSFVKAVYANIADHALMIHMPTIESGKDKRSEFTYAQFEYILEYWKIEAELFHALVNKLRELLYDAGLFIAKWHGPGELANYAYRTNGIRRHKADCGETIYDRARFAYAGGRFERFHIGRYQRVFGYDINSAYPFAISQLPSLSEGQWRWRGHVDTNIAEFGVYRIRLRSDAGQPAGPLFHRDKRGNISYPWNVDGWYWSPEVKAMIAAYPKLVSCIEEGWEYVEWETRPFEFVKDVYEQRRYMKANGIGTQMALKLLLNSLYGKQAQRAGWKRNGKAPTWHQLEWAGWVTSHTRAQLYAMMARIPFENLIAVETDGLFTTCSPIQMKITDGSDLGGWEVTEIEELIYLQSGFYAKRIGPDWSLKYRGLDAKSVSVESVIDHCKALGPIRAPRHEWNDPEWPKLTGVTTRFIGYQNALFRATQNRGPFHAHHRVWETDKKEYSTAGGMKRIHSPWKCKACTAGANAYEMPHDTVVRSPFDPEQIFKGKRELDYMSHPHDIPWLDGSPEPYWREVLESQEGLLQ
jgi:hypothetical protein